MRVAVAKTIVNMEQSYVTAAFFRHRTAERYKAMMQAQQTAKLLGEGAFPSCHRQHVLCKNWFQGAPWFWPPLAVLSGHNAVCAWLVGLVNPALMALPLLWRLMFKPRMP